MPRVPRVLHKETESIYYLLELPKLPINILDWIEVARPTVGKIVRNFDLSPFLRDIYEDNSPNIMIVAGRQTYKTTLCTDFIANYATANPRSVVCLVTDNESHLSAVSKQRLRIETFLQNPILRQFLRHDRANIGEISLNNDSVIYLVTDEGEYKKVEGKSLGLLMLDEAQYQDVQFLTKAMYSLFQTHGRILILDNLGKTPECLDVAPTCQSGQLTACPILPPTIQKSKHFRESTAETAVSAALMQTLLLSLGETQHESDGCDRPHPPADILSGPQGHPKAEDDPLP